MKMLMTLTVIVVSALLISCASTSSTYLTSTKFAPKAETCDLDILNLPPTDKKFVEIARINAKGGQTIFEGSDLTSMLPGIKKEACKLGADAVILASVYEGGMTWVGPKDRGSASAIALKYKN